MNTTTKPGVLAVMARDAADADAWRLKAASTEERQMFFCESEEARATVERLADAVDGALDVLGPTVKPVPAEVKRLALMNLRAALEEFRGAA